MRDTPPQGPPLGGSRQSPSSAAVSQNDPYRYQTGFGNLFSSEAVPETLPTSCNTPQKVKYGLYSEQLNGTSFVSSRASAQNVWMYRIFPSAAHGRFSRADINPDLRARFGPDSAAEFVPHSLCWQPFQMPPRSEASIDFVEGLNTVAGHGDSVTKEGVAVHFFVANRSMDNRAFCNNDGDLLILPQHGRVDIQTELGRMMVRPGELAVVQAGIRFKVNLPDGPVRGYVQEVFGSHYELPELGPLGSNGMALPRHFEHPVASFDLDKSQWEIVYKLAGALWSCKQTHTPFDVVAWHGNYVPYKYALEKFVPAAVVDRDQSDPSVYCVLTAKSKTQGVSLAEFMAFTPKWNVSSDSFRPPYYHRNMATEIMGLLYGEYGGSSKALRPGGLSFQASFMPHGETHRVFLEATTRELKPERVGEGSLAFMFHISNPCAVTKHALERPEVEEQPASLWNDMEGHFFDHISDHVSEELKRIGLKPLGTPPR